MDRLGRWLSWGLGTLGRAMWRRTFWLLLLGSAVLGAWGGLWWSDHTRHEPEAMTIPIYVRVTAAHFAHFYETEAPYPPCSSIPASVRVVPIPRTFKQEDSQWLYCLLDVLVAPGQRP